MEQVVCFKLIRGRDTQMTTCITSRLNAADVLKFNIKSLLLNAIQ